MSRFVSDESQRGMVGAAARLASSQWTFADALARARAAGLDDAKLASLLGIPEAVVICLRVSWNME